MPASKHPEPFNELMSVLVESLFILDNNEALTYAMYKTKTYFQDGQVQYLRCFFVPRLES